ncbi:DUF5123 domain-containing protein [Bacteroides sp.]
MKTRIIYAFLSCMLLLAAACEDDVNNWPVDESQDGLFRSLTFEEKKVAATSIEISYTKVVNATDYIFEFSEDSLLFQNISRVVTIKADTLTPFAESTTQMKIEYRTIFEDLKGVTKYSVRMKAVSSISGRESGYVSFFFQTPEEQIFTKVLPEIEQVTLTWMPVKSLTHLVISERNESDELFNPREIQLTQEMVDAGSIVVSGLTGGTAYMAQAFDGEVKRGEIKFRTTGMQNGEVIHVTESDTITYLLDDCAARKVTDVSLVFKGGVTYNSGSVTIPGGIENLVFVGVSSDTGEAPVLEIPAISMNEVMNEITFENVSLDGMNDGKNYLFSIGNSNCFKSIRFKSCSIAHYNRSVVRFNTDKLDIDEVSFEDCLISDIAHDGYAMIVFGKAQTRVGLVSITKSTLTEMGSLMQINDGVEKVVMDQCIVYNHTFGTGNFYRIDKQPGEIAVTNTIFAGSNGGKKFNATYSNYSTYFLFTSCYVTSDVVTDRYTFTDSTPYSGTSEELFVDPVNGDFHLNPNAKFPGKETAGDPRWW